MESISEKFNCETVTVKVGDIFNQIGGVGTLGGAYCIAHPGKYPVYTGATKNKPYYIDSYRFDEPHLSYVSVGYAKLRILEGKYSLGQNRKILTPKKSSENLYLPYFVYALEPGFAKAQKNTHCTFCVNLTWRAAKEVEVEIPVTPDGEFDLEKQKEIARFYEMQDNFKKETLEGLKSAQSKTLIDFEPEKDYETITVKVGDIFKGKRGNSKLTKGYCFHNPGKFEVFTGTTKGSFGFIDTYEYDSPQLTYTTDGHYAGSAKVLTGKYNVGGHRNILTPIKDNLYLKYFEYVLPQLIMSKKKNGSVPSLTWRIVSNEEVEIPVTPDGEFDLEKQKELAEHYARIEKYRNIIDENIERLGKVTY